MTSPPKPRPVYMSCAPKRSVLGQVLRIILIAVLAVPPAMVALNIFPLDIHEDYIKRVNGLGGDTVAVRNKQVYVNNQPLEEPYIAAAPTYTGTWVVPEENLFVLGINRNMSSDSYSWGFVPEELVVGKALIRYWPLDQFRILN